MLRPTAAILSYSPVVQATRHSNALTFGPETSGVPTTKPLQTLRMLLSTAKLVSFLLLIVAASNIALVLQELPVQSVVFVALEENLPHGDLALAYPSRYLPLGQTASPSEMRDSGFDWLNVRPDARAWMQDLPVTYEPTSPLAGSYHLESMNVTLSRPYLHVVLHKYAHANFAHKGFAEKTQCWWECCAYCWMTTFKTRKPEGLSRVCWPRALRSCDRMAATACSTKPTPTSPNGVEGTSQRCLITSSRSTPTFSLREPTPGFSIRPRQFLARR